MTQPAEWERSNQFIRVLVVDPDPGVQRSVETAFDQCGFQTSYARSVEEAFDLLDRYGLPHAAVVELEQPSADGWTFGRRLNRRVDLPLIAVSCDEDPETAVRALESFADDYVRKPFAAAELAARITGLLRRIGNLSYTSEGRVRVDSGLEVDFAHGQAYVEDQSISLTPIESRLLYILVRNSGRTVRTDFLLRRLWPRGEVYEDCLRSHMYRLRKKICSDSKRDGYITNERGIGYRLVVAP